MDKPVVWLAAKARDESAVADNAGGFSAEKAATAAPGPDIGLARSGGTGPRAVSARNILSVPRTGESQNIASELLGFCRDKIGAKRMSAIISGAPGLSNFT